jgi:glycosyltransferase involved in cell wall biosynthesis
VTAEVRSACADVTVIIPAHDAEATIAATLLSLAGQTRRPAAVLVVDDASKRPLDPLVARYRSLLPLDVIRFEQNQGTARALTAGVERASTTCVTFFGADDIAMPNHVALLERARERFGEAISADAWLWWPGGCRKLVRWTRGRPPPGGDPLGELVRRNWSLGVLYLARSEVLGIGGFRHLMACEDWDFNLRLLDSDVAIHRIDVPTMLYRQGAPTRSKGERAELAAALLLEDFSRHANHGSVAGDARRSGREHRRKAALQRAYGYARSGDRSRARRAAGEAGGGGRAIFARSLAVRAAPLLATALHDRVAWGDRRFPGQPVRSAGFRPSVSVVVRARGPDAELDASLASIALQTTPVGEVVVVGRGAVVGDSAWAARWRPHLPVHVVADGHPDERTDGWITHLPVTRGEVIATMDAGDFWLPDHLELALAAGGGGPIAVRSRRVEDPARRRPGTGRPPVARGLCPGLIVDRRLVADSAGTVTLPHPQPPWRTVCRPTWCRPAGGDDELT